MEDTSVYLNPYRQIDQHGSKLPHWHQGDALQFVTFRLKDALPQSKLRVWRAEKENWFIRHPKPWTPELDADYEATFTERIEEWLDAGMGSSLFKLQTHREPLAATIQRAEPASAEHHAWVIMPNHVHLLFRPKRPLPELIKAWKRSSAAAISKGSIWQRNYRDTLIRNGRHYARAVRYIRNNPRNLPEGSFTLWQSETAKRVM